MTMMEAAEKVYAENAPLLFAAACMKKPNGELMAPWQIAARLDEMADVVRGFKPKQWRKLVKEVAKHNG